MARQKQTTTAPDANTGADIEREQRRALARAARAEYKRQWAKKNPDKVKAAQERYWQKQGEKMAAERAAREAETRAAGGGRYAKLNINP